MNHLIAEPILPTQAPTRSLRLNFSWTMTGNVVYAASQWGILLMLARLGNPEAVGEFSLGLAITAPVLLFSGLQLRAIQATDAHDRFQFADYAGLRLLTSTAAVLGTCIVSAILQTGRMRFIVAAFALAKGVESFSDVVYGLWQHHERLDLVAQSLILRGVLSVAAAAGCFLAFGSVWTAVCGIAAVWLVVFCAFDLRHAYKVAGNRKQLIFPRFSRPSLKQLVHLALPLGIGTMLTSFSGNVPRYVIGHVRGVTELGIFSAVGYVLLAGGMIVNALGQSSIPRLAYYSSQNRMGDFWRLSNTLLLAGMILGVTGIAVAASFGSRIITMMYGSEYAGDTKLLVWLTVAAAASYLASFAGYSLTAAGHFRVQIPLLSFITALTAAACYVMVKSGGAVGVAKALTLAGFVQLAASMTILRYKERRRFVTVS